MDNGKDIHQDFTPELKKEGEDFGFIYEQVKEWIEVYDFTPYDAEFAVYLGDQEFIISDMTREEVNNLREEYNKAFKNKEIDLALDKKGEEEEVITFQERDGRGIHFDFTPDLVQGGQKCGFDYEEAQDWINAGMKVFEVEFCSGLRDFKKVDAEWILNCGNIRQLQNEYQQYCWLAIQQVQTKEQSFY